MSREKSFHLESMIDLSLASDKKLPEYKLENDDVIQRINGNFGRWQLRAVLLIFLTKIPSAWFMACIIFTAPTPRDGEYFCHPPTNVLNSQTQEKFERILDFNKTAWISMLHPVQINDYDGSVFFDFCNIYADGHNVSENYFHKVSSITEDWISPERNDSSVTVPCERFYHHSDYNSLVTDFNLVCSKDILIASTQFFHLFGVLTGGLLATYLLKHFSPKSVMLFGMVTQIFCGNMTGLVNSYELHVFFRCLSAICCCQMYTAGGMIFSDITSGKPKSIITTLFEQFWSIGVIILPFLAHWMKSWSHLYMAISWPTVILIILWRWIPNSPYWMVARGRIDEARDILIESAIINDRKHVIPSNLEYLLRQQSYNIQNAPSPAGWWSLWKGPKAIRHMICVHVCWSIYIITYYGMLLNIRTFSREHLEINTIIAASCEILGVFCALILILYTKRKWMYTGLFNIIGGLIAYSAWMIPFDLEPNLRVTLLMILSMVSKTAISSTLAILTTCTTELVCEEKKKICAFSTIVYARIWLLSAPFIGTTDAFGQLIPQTALSTMAIVGGVLSTLISSPRTISTPVKHSNLPKEIYPEIYTITNYDSLSSGEKCKC